MKEEKIKNYIDKLQEKDLYCKRCGEQKKLEDFYITVSKNGNIKKECNACRKSTSEKSILRRVSRKGF